MPRFEQRRIKLRRLMKKAQVDSLLVTNSVNVSYLTGFTGDDSFLFVMRDGEVLLTDGRFTTQLCEECPGLELDVRNSGVTIAEAGSKVIAGAKISKVGIESQSMTVGLLARFEEKLEKVAFVPTSGLVEQLREIKDAEEIAALRLAVRHAERGFGVLRASLRGNQSEREIANELEYQLRRFGSEGCSFKPIVAVGPRAALPHATPGEHSVDQHDFILVDWGALGGHYCSDLTRVLVTGKISPKLQRVYGVVLKAQRTAIAAIKPGAVLEKVDEAARRVIAKAGYDKYFGHSLGHGLGMEVHESPRLAPGQKGQLKAGMVVTVEPGIYVPNWGGVRIEDDVLVTKNGHEVLSSVPNELEQCVV